MTQDSRIEELLSLWEASREKGKTLSPEELCHHCPELLPELQRQIDILRRAERALKGRDTLSAANAPDNPQQTLTLRKISRESPWVAEPDAIPGYTILGELGRGGMGVVYRARQHRIDRIVALKILPDLSSAGSAGRERFERESKAIAQLQHPNIVQIFEVGEYHGRPFYTMEYLDGGTLADRLRPDQLPKPEQSARCVLLLARAMAAAHHQGLLHRDLKPSNVLLGNVPERDLQANKSLLASSCVLYGETVIPKIADFGLVKRLDSTEHTTTGVIVGTPSYMAPEQATGDAKTLGPTVDVHALGAILYEMLTGRAPFLGDTLLEVLDRVRHQEPVPPRQLQTNVPRDLETICLKCLQKEPHRRYADAQALADDLQRFLEDRPIVARPAGPIEQVCRWCRRNPSWATLSALLVVLTLALIGTEIYFRTRLADELDRTRQAHDAARQARKQLRYALTQELADRIESDLRQLATIPETIAHLLAQRPMHEEHELMAWLSAILQREPNVFGLTIGYESEVVPQQPYFAVYVFRRGESIVQQRLQPHFRSPNFREEPWYRLAQQRGTAFWGEPYRDADADLTPMVTYSVPIFRNGRFIGVASVDLSVSYFANLRQRLDKLMEEVDARAFVLTPGGWLLYHTDARLSFPAPGSDLRTHTLTPESEAMRQRFFREEAGEGEVIDFPSGQSVRVQFARIEHANWVLVILLPKSEAD